MTLYSFSMTPFSSLFFFFFNDTATTEIYTLSLHDALPICSGTAASVAETHAQSARSCSTPVSARRQIGRAQSELQSQFHLVCRLLLEKKKKVYNVQQDVKKLLSFHHRSDSVDSQHTPVRP